MDGHQYLIQDLKEVLAEAEGFRFHDFKSSVATPKVELVHHLGVLTENAKNGKYDNDATPKEANQLMDKLKGAGNEQV